MNDFIEETRAGYDRAAAEYARRLFNELDYKPKTRDILRRFAGLVRGKGPVCDLGCGPGEIAAFLAQQGIDDVFGIDLSPQMVLEAARLSPKIPFRVGNMLALDALSGSWAGIAAFYSIIHIPREQVVEALRELKRVLKPGGVLLLTFHLGNTVIRTQEFMGEQVGIDFYLFEVAEMYGYLCKAGFVVDEIIQRAPYPDVESQTRRAYVFAHKPGE
ncbi:MAG TPA: class I SAM-dependent methyltransferase [Anaerolineaceae bacterium]